MAVVSLAAFASVLALNSNRPHPVHVQITAAESPVCVSELIAFSYCLLPTQKWMQPETAEKAVLTTAIIHFKDAETAAL